MNCPKCKRPLKNSADAEWLGIPMLCADCCGVPEYYEGMTKGRVDSNFAGPIAPKVEHADRLHKKK